MADAVNCSLPVVPTTETIIKAQNDKNQSLISALYDLSRFLDDTTNNSNNLNSVSLSSTSSNNNYKYNNNYSNNNNKYKSRALETAVLNLSQLEYEIVDGKSLIQGKKKVKGVGKATAYYIDEFRRTGKIKELEKYQNKTIVKTLVDTVVYPQVVVSNINNSHNNSINEDDDSIVQINRAPVLSLWVTIVAEAQGYNHNEALSYAQWITGLFARSKGKSIGIFDTDDNDNYIQEQNETMSYKKKRRLHYSDTNDEDDSEVSSTNTTRTTKTTSTIAKSVQYNHICIFHGIQIPYIVDLSNGDRIAVEYNTAIPIDTVSTDRYIQHSFGPRLEAVKDAMKYLVHTFRTKNSLGDDDDDEKTKTTTTTTSDPSNSNKYCYNEVLQKEAYRLYEYFRPEWCGWGQKSTLHLLKIRNARTMIQAEADGGGGDKVVIRKK